MSALRAAGAFVSLLVVLACGTSGDAVAPTTPTLPFGDANYAKSAPTNSPTVTSTAPSEAPRDTTLDVQINGSGFDKGSVAAFTLGGVLDARVRVNSTRYVRSGQVVANVTIAADAVASMYDVAVTTSGGKKGIGTELFAVELKGELLAGGMLAGGVDASGDVAGWANIGSTCSGPYAGYVWRPDGSRIDLPLTQGYCGASTKAMNSSGVVLASLFGGASGDPSGLWVPSGSGYTLTPLSPTSDGIYPVAMALNDANEVIGWHEQSARLFWRSPATGWLPVAAPAGATACQLRALNNVGGIVGMCSASGAPYEGYYWPDHNGLPTKLPRPTATGDVWPSAINDDGVIAGYVYGANPGRAVRWTPSAGGFTAALLPDLGLGGAAGAIASDGSIVGSVNRTPTSVRPALWSPDGRFSILETHNGSGGEAEGVAMTSNGIVIAGYENLSGKQTMRWRAPQ